jgi:capsular polysaccharide biosynthesis protein
VALISPAWAQSSPVKPAKPLLALLVALGALALAVGVGYALDVFDRRVRADEIPLAVGELPVLGAVPSYTPEVVRAVH